MTGIVNEEWRTISDYENYQISNMGRVKNIKTEKILKLSIGYRGYCQISLWKDGKGTTSMVHRKVAHEFLENPKEELYIDHIDRNRTNNCINNLRWVNSSQNQMNRTKSINKTSAFKGVSFEKNIGKWRCQIRIDGKLQRHVYFEIEKDAARKYDEIAALLFGEYAHRNVPEGEEEE